MAVETIEENSLRRRAQVNWHCAASAVRRLLAQLAERVEDALPLRTRGVLGETFTSHGAFWQWARGSNN